jgi:DNA-binding transcriptional LysR family regulator
VILPGTVSVNNADAYHACCRAGMGLIQAPRYHLEQALATGELVEVLAPLRPDPLPVSVLYPITGNCRRACAYLPTGSPACLWRRINFAVRHFLDLGKEKIPPMPSGPI